MRKFGFVLAICLLVLTKTVLACSVSVNDKFQKNLLVASAANHLDISLSSVSSTMIADYSRVFIGEDPVTLCPEFLKAKGKISFKYSPGKYQNCDASVIVSRKQYMGEDPSVPLEQLTFTSMTASCSTSLPRPVPRPCIPRISC